MADELTTSVAQTPPWCAAVTWWQLSSAARGQWRTERTKLVELIAKPYDDTERRLRDGQPGDEEVGREE